MAYMLGVVKSHPDVSHPLCDFDAPFTLARWGDHLYNKGEFDAAMTQYLDTLTCLEPSYVIRW